MDTLIILGSVALILLIFVLIFILFYLQRTLKKVDLVLTESENNLKKLNSMFNSISNVGDIAEKETERIKGNYMLKMNQLNEKQIDSSDGLASLLVSSIILGIKYFKGR